MSRVWILTVVTTFCLSAMAWGQSVFDMPRLFPQHRVYLAQFIQATQRGDLLAAEVAARSAAKIFPDDANWHYNVACVCAKDNRATEALEWLETAINLGFTDAEGMLADTDLLSLHQDARFVALVEKAKTLSGRPQQMAALQTARWSDVTIGTEAEVTAANTQWDWDPISGGYMITKFALREGESTASKAYIGPYAELIAPWIAEGSASGNAGELYVNRDEDQTQVRYESYPGLTPVVYAEDAVAKGAHLGAANGIFLGKTGSVPVVGNSILTIRKMPYWRSMARMFSTEPTMNAMAFRLAVANQLYLYDATIDYKKAFKGDLLVSNTPQYLLTTDLAEEGALPAQAQSEMTELVLATLAALPKETKQEMYRRNLLLPTIQRLLREHIKGADDYFSPAAHPTVFDPKRIDGEAVIRAAHALKPEDLPPFFQLVARQDTMPQQYIDYFDVMPSEGFADTPMCITRVIRGVSQTRAITIEAALPTEPGLTYRWFVVNGDPAKITLSPLTSNGSLVTIEVKHHAPYTTHEGMPTRRVDIACIAVREDGTTSAPAFVSFRSLGNERRTYDAQGRIAQMDYTQPVYEDLTLSAAKNWVDTYHYDAQGVLTGWTRTRPDSDVVHCFDAQGRRIVERDRDGKPSKVVNVTYRSVYAANSNGIHTPATELVYTDAGEPFTVTP